MTTKLGVFTTQVGTVSETFIRRHIEDLLPGRTVAVVRYSAPPSGGFWEVSCPVMFLDRWRQQLHVRLAVRAGVSLAGLRDAAVSRFLRRHGVTAVLGEYLDQFVDFVPLLDRMRIPYVAEGLGIDVSAELRKPAVAERMGAYRSARAILTRSEFHRRRLIELGLPADKILVNPGGVDVSLEPAVRGPDACKRFLAVGRMVPKKAPIYLLEAFRLAASQDPDITLDYIGGGTLFPAAQQFVYACKLRDRVRLHGPVSGEPYQRLRVGCGVFVQHSITDPETGDEEGLPTSILEAMADGMVTISTRHAGIPEAVENGKTGWLVEEGDVEGMAEAMVCCAREGGVSAKLGAAAHRRALEMYNWPAERARLLGAMGHSE